MSNSYTAGTLTYEWKCAACGLEATEVFRIASGGQLPWPTLPGGWREIDSYPARFYCPLHELQQLLVVDGKLITGGY
jgi:hypothetical protein